MEKQNKKVTYRKEQVMDTVADVLAELTIKLKDPSLVIAGALAMDILDKKLKQILMWAGLLKPTHYQLQPRADINI